MTPEVRQLLAWATTLCPRSAHGRSRRSGAAYLLQLGQALLAACLATHGAPKALPSACCARLACAMCRRLRGGCRATTRGRRQQEAQGRRRRGGTWPAGESGTGAGAVLGSRRRWCSAPGGPFGVGATAPWQCCGAGGGSVSVGGRVGLLRWVESTAECSRGASSPEAVCSAHFAARPSLCASFDTSHTRTQSHVWQYLHMQHGSHSSEYMCKP